METSLGRHCRICGAIISDYNPDGVGAQCREVWERARRTTFYHFCGLEYWKAKVDWWMPAFILAFRFTKFRSDWKRNFFLSLSAQYKEGKNISSKQLNIVIDWLIGSSHSRYPSKYSPETLEGELLLEGEEAIKHRLYYEFSHSMTDEQSEYMENCAKKYYGEAGAKRKS